MFKKLIAANCIILLFLAFSVSAQNVKKGEKALKKGDFDRAKEVFDEVILKNKNQKDVVRANYGLSQLYVNKEYSLYNLQLSSKFIEQAITIHKSLSDSEIKDLESSDINYNSLFKQKLFIENELNRIKSETKKEDDKIIIENTLNNLPDSKNIKDEKKRNIQELYNKAARSKSEEALNEFINKNPNASQIPDAINLRNSIAFENAKTINTVESFQKFIDLYPEAEQVTEAIIFRNQMAYISILEKTKEMQNLSLEKNRIELENSKKTKALFSASIILLLLLGIVSFYAYRKTKKNNKDLTEQKLLVDIKHKEITDSINYAERIQRSLLANKKLLDSYLNDYFILFKPKDVVSGDFYWATSLDTNKICIVTADSTGHGVPGAIMSMINMNSLKEAITKGLTQADDILNYARNIIINTLANDGSNEGGKDGMDCSLIIIDKKNLLLEWVGANNPIWVVSKNETSNKLIELKPQKMPIGRHYKQNEPFIKQTLQLNKGDIIYTLTDGFADQFGGSKLKKYMSKNLKNFLLSQANLSMAEQKLNLESVFLDWKSDLEQIDDVLVMGIKV